MLRSARVIASIVFCFALSMLMNESLWGFQEKAAEDDSVEKRSLEIEDIFYDGLDRYFELWPDSQAVHCDYVIRRWMNRDTKLGEANELTRVSIAMNPRGTFRFEYDDGDHRQSFWIDKDKGLYYLSTEEPPVTGNPNREPWLTERFGPQVAEFFWPYPAIRFSRGWVVSQWSEHLEEDNGNHRFVQRIRGWEHADWVDRDDGYQILRKLSKPIIDQRSATRRTDFENVLVQGVWIPKKVTIVCSRNADSSKDDRDNEPPMFCEIELVGEARFLPDAIEPPAEAIVFQKPIDPKAKRLPSSITGMIIAGDVDAVPTGRVRPQPEQEDPSMGRISSTLQRLGIGAVILVIGYVAFLKWRSSQQNESSEHD